MGVGDVLDFFFVWLTPPLMTDYGYYPMTRNGKNLKLKLLLHHPQFGAHVSESDAVFVEIAKVYPPNVASLVEHYDTLTDERLAEEYGLIRDEDAPFKYRQPFYWSVAGVVDTKTGNVVTRITDAADSQFNCPSSFGAFVYA